MQLDTDVARIFENTILWWPVDDGLTWVDLSTDTEMHLHFGEDLIKKRKREEEISNEINFEKTKKGFIFLL